MFAFLELFVIRIVLFFLINPYFDSLRLKGLFLSEASLVKCQY